MLYIVRLASRVDNYMACLIDLGNGDHDSLPSRLRGGLPTQTTQKVLADGLLEIRTLLRGDMLTVLEGYAAEAYREVCLTFDAAVWIFVSISRGVYPYRIHFSPEGVSVHCVTLLVNGF